MTAGLPCQRAHDVLAGRRLWIEVPGQTRITYAWDAASRLTQIQQGGQILAFTYDAVNRRTLLTLPNGVSTEYEYDAGSPVTR